MEVSASILRYTTECKRKFPELSSRFDRAGAIVHRGGYTRISDTTWIIPSSSGGMYVVNGHCGCADYTGIHPQSSEQAKPEHRAPRGWCKHRLAMLMLIKLATDSERAAS